MASLLFRGLISQISKLTLDSKSIFCNKVLTNVNCRTICSSSFVCNKPNIGKIHQEYVTEQKDQGNVLANDIIKKINDQIAKNEQGRLFAVVQIAGKQYKITPGDIIIIEGYWPPNVGDILNLEKILLIGGADFSLIGRPLVEHGLAQVKATVIEKTISHTKTHFRKLKRKQYMRINFYRVQQTMLRINSIDIIEEVNNPLLLKGNEEIIH